MPGMYPKSVRRRQIQNSAWHSRFRNTPKGGSRTARTTENTSMARPRRYSWSMAATLPSDLYYSFRTFGTVLRFPPSEPYDLQLWLSQFSCGPLLVSSSSLPLLLGQGLGRGKFGAKEVNRCGERNPDRCRWWIRYFDSRRAGLSQLQGCGELSSWFQGWVGLGEKRACPSSRWWLVYAMLAVCWEREGTLQRLRRFRP